jgi:tRNA pseudouridine32 synthase/23S rRNA pseudouridine746 synthase
MKLDLIFENEHFAILDKPALVLSTPSREGPADERECLGMELQKQLKIQIFPVHRLDFEVSGLVMFAKNAQAHRLANAWFENKQIFKIYQAYTSGQGFDHIPAEVKNFRDKLEPKGQEKFFWKSRLIRGKRRSYAHATGKPSETEAIYIGKDAKSKWHRWELHPLTGRPHQLRFELSSHGFPIIGDELYGSKLIFTKPGIALRAIKIDFTKTKEAKALGLPQTLEISSLFS